VDTEHHLIVTHEVTNSGSDRAQLANVAKQAKAVLKTERLEAVADRGYFSSREILACHEAGITITLPKPQTSGAKSEGRFGKQDFAYLRAGTLRHQTEITHRRRYHAAARAIKKGASVRNSAGCVIIFGGRQ
jgi:hypothetical protein